MPKPRVIKLKSIVDLVHVLNVSQLAIIHHIVVDSKHIYFIPTPCLGDSGVIYYYESEEPFNGRYIIFNKFTGEVGFSNNISGDSRLTYIPIVEVEKQNLFAEKVFVERKKKKAKKHKGEEL